jgi:hypothetical protein
MDPIGGKDAKGTRQLLVIPRYTIEAALLPFRTEPSEFLVMPASGSVAGDFQNAEAYEQIMGIRRLAPLQIRRSV